MPPISSQHGPAAPSATGLPRVRCGEPGSRRWKDAPLAQELFIIHNLMMRLGDRLVGEFGLTGSRWLLMGALDRYGEPPTLSELSQDALLSLQNVSRMVSAMEADGLVERFSKPGGGRRIYVRLTPRGEEVKARTHDRGVLFTSGMLAGLSPDDLARAQDIVDRLMANLEKFESEFEDAVGPCGRPGLIGRDCSAPKSQEDKP